MNEIHIILVGISIGVCMFVAYMWGEHEGKKIKEKDIHD